MSLIDLSDDDVDVCMFMTAQMGLDGLRATDVMISHTLPSTAQREIFGGGFVSVFIHYGKPNEMRHMLEPDGAEKLATFLRGNVIRDGKQGGTYTLCDALIKHAALARVATENDPSTVH